ncbi:MAG: copper homeostasis protein CutC [Candidatus Delongbacteria bacterium]|nr:copper homeostasis protein CutC [Candidatus Delongbacteria bacterium]MBN2835451.1 copper homeostasis protein CutC [Candidatus Delongbacteria bacterium]
MINLEICVDSISSALNAFLGCANRIELCDNLYCGGTTPSSGTIRHSVKLGETFVLIRPRCGDFIYNRIEKDVIIDDIKLAIDYGASGIVCGCLDEYGNIDEDFLEELLKVSDKVDFTFHRAIDMSNNILKNTEILTNYPIKRVLSSGGSQTAESGLDNLKEMNRILTGKGISLIAAGGVRIHNVEKILNHSGVNEIHMTAFCEKSSISICQSNVTLDQSGDYKLKITDIDKVREVCKLLNNRRSI